MTITFTHEEGWVLTDGLDDKPSTNGTWSALGVKFRLYLNDEMSMYNKMVFRALQTLFEVEVKNP